MQPLPRVVTLVAGLTTAAVAAVAAPETYTADPAHTYASFKISHLGFSTLHGRFNKAEGKVILDRQAKSGTVDIAIDTHSVDTGWPKRDAHLQSEDFFNVAQFPTIHFKSDQLQFQGEMLTTVNGELTLLGVTRPVTLTVTAFHCGEHPMAKKQACGADATTTIKRSDFGMSKYLPALGDEVKIVVDIEAYKE